MPNHLTDQWAAEFLRLYPSANILVTTKKDFETRNRKKFCARIATGDYDAVIIGHSQFEKIPISPERQERLLRQQIEEITEGISEVKANRGENFTIKSLERTKKGLEARLKKLQDTSRKDDVITFSMYLPLPFSREIGMGAFLRTTRHGRKPFPSLKIPMPGVLTATAILW